jgi:hypothetical protein
VSARTHSAIAALQVSRAEAVQGAQ